MPEFCPGQSANEVHFALKSALKSMAEAEKCAVICFGEIMERRLYRELGYGSINQYAEIELGFSPRRTADFVMLCKRLNKLPLVKKQVESGKLGYTVARVIAPVVDQSNESGWVDFALKHSRRDLEREVKRARKEAVDTAKGQQQLLPLPTSRPAAVVPVRVSLEMTPTQFAQYEALWEQIDAPAGKVEALLEIMRSFAAETRPRGRTSPPVQIHIHQCEDCAKASIQTGKGELEISKAELEQAECDCQISRPGKRNTTSIPPATRRAVLAKYRHKCQRPGCNHTRYLQIHHKIPRSRGGSNDPDNLICLCQACHKLHHEKTGLNSYAIPRGGDQVKSPTPIYQWGSGPTAGQSTTTPMPHSNGPSYLFTRSNGQVCQPN